MSTHNIYFLGEIRKYLSGYFSFLELTCTIQNIQYTKLRLEFSASTNSYHMGINPNYHTFFSMK